MIILPAHWPEHARDGSDFIYLIDIVPRGSDTWPAYRFADRSVTVDGNAYLGGYISRVDTIRRKADITRGGTIATRDPVNIELVNKNELHRQFQINEIAGRDVMIQLAMMPLNMVRNSGFEAPTSGNNFDHWTENAGHASNSITRETTIKRSGAQSCKLTCVTASPAPNIVSADMPIENGTTVSVSFYARAVAASDVLRVAVRLEAFYWNNSTKQWGVGVSTIDVTPSASSFDRFSIDGIYHPGVSIPGGTTSDITLEFSVPNAGDGIYLDDVMVEPRLKSGTYHGGRYDMIAADVKSAYVGECEAPKWNRSLVTIATKSVNNRRRKRIPVTRISPETTDPDFVIPPENLLKPFPMTYGDFFFDHHPANKLYPDGMLPAIGVLVNSRALDNPVRVYFDRPGLTHGSGLLYVWDSGRQRFWRERIDTSASDYSEWTGGTNSYRESKSDADYLRRAMFPVSALLFAEDANPQRYDYALWTNPENIADEDLATFGDLTLVSDLLPKHLALHGGNPTILGRSEVIAAYALGKVTTILNSGTATRQLIVGAINDSVGTVLATMTGTGLVDNIPTGVETDAQEMDFPLTLDDNTRQGSFWASPDTSILLRCIITGGSTPNVTFRAYAVGVRIDFAIELEEAMIFRSLTGRLGGGCQGHNVIKDIYETELGVPSGDIRSSAFSAISVSGTTAGQLIDERWSDEVIADICSVQGYVQFTDGSGKESIAELVHGAAAKVMGKDYFALDKLELGYTKREDIYSSYTLKFGRVPVEEVYLAEIHCNRTSQDVGDAAYATKCDGAYDALGEIENPLDMETHWINDKTAAQTALKRKIDWNRGRKRTVRGPTDIRAFELEFGDRIDIRLEDYLKERDTDTERPIFMLKEMTIDRSRITVELLEVLKP